MCWWWCTVQNFYWEDVCEDVLTLRDSKNANAKFYVKGGAANNGINIIIQHNSADIVFISDFYVQNSGKLYRACGNCKSGYQDKPFVHLKNVNAINVKVLIGINSNYGDITKYESVSHSGGNICQRFIGRNDGKEPIKDRDPINNNGSWACS